MSVMERRSLPVIFHSLVAILFFVRSRRSPLRLRTNGKQSAQQSNEICSGSNDRLGIIRATSVFGKDFFRGKCEMMEGYLPASSKNSNFAVKETLL